MKPITPQQVKKEFELPDMAITVINKMITQHFTGSESIFNKAQLSFALIEVGYNNAVIESIFKRIPKVYSQFGWNVEETHTGFIFQELMN